VRFALGVVLEEAVRRDILARNVARLAELPRKVAKPEPRSSLTPKEADRLIDAVKGHRLEALVAVDALLRAADGRGHRVDVGLCGLAARDPDGPPVAQTAPRRDHGHRWDEGAVEPRATDPDSPAAAELSLLRTHRTEERLAAPAWEDFDLVFPNQIGRPIDPSNLRREITGLCQDAGIDPAISPNDLAASVLVNAEVPLEEVANFLGHTNARMLAQTYHHRVKRVVDLTVAQEGMLTAD
jgi:integrase